MQLITSLCVTKGNILWGSAELQNAQKNHDNLICVYRSVIYTFLCKQEQKQALPSKRRKYCAMDVSIFSKPEMKTFYSASDFDIDASKANGTDYEPARLRVMRSSLDR